jgi:hypothetical protein
MNHGPYQNATRREDTAVTPQLATGVKSGRLPIMLRPDKFGAIRSIKLFRLVRNLQDDLSIPTTLLTKEQLHADPQATVGGR